MGSHWKVVMAASTRKLKQRSGQEQEPSHGAEWGGCGQLFGCRNGLDHRLGCSTAWAPTQFLPVRVVQGELLMPDAPETIERLLRQEQVRGGRGGGSPMTARTH